MIFIVIVSIAAQLILCAVIADKKSRSVGGWIVGGMFLGWIAVIILCCLSDLSYNYVPAGKSICDVPLPKETEIARIDKYRCAHCGELIDTEQCPWCGKYKDK